MNWYTETCHVDSINEDHVFYNQGLKAMENGFVICMAQKAKNIPKTTG